MERNLIWHALIKSEYRLYENGWDYNVLITGSSQCPWNDISQGLNSCAFLCRFGVGNGERVGKRMRGGKQNFILLLVCTDYHNLIMLLVLVCV